MAQTLILKTLPNAKDLQKLFTVGKAYYILGSIGNGYIIENDEGTKSIVLKSSFESTAEFSGPMEIKTSKVWITQDGEPKLCLRHELKVMEE